MRILSLIALILTSPNWNISQLTIGTPIRLRGCQFYSRTNKAINAVWLRDDKEIAQTAYKSLVGGIYFVNDYQIPSARLENEGFYQCALKVNGNLTAWSIPKELKLQGKEKAIIRKSR